MSMNVFFILLKKCGEYRSRTDDLSECNSERSTFELLILGVPISISFTVCKSNLVENIGVEPMTSCVQGRRSSQLS